MRPMQRCYYILCCFCAAGTFAQATPLGQRTSASGAVNKSVTVPGQKIQLKAMTSSLGSSYSVKTVTDEARTMKEFINSDGVVFAVSWDGYGRPDFAEIFGTYYADYQMQLKTRNRAIGRNVVATGDSQFVITNISRGPVMMGLAYVPGLLPAGVAAEDLK